MILQNLTGLTPEFKTEKIPVPEIQEDGEILVREMNGAEIAEFRARLDKGESQEKLAAYMLHTAVITEAGERQLPDAETAEKFLQAIPARCADRITAAIFKLNTGAAEKNS